VIVLTRNPGVHDDLHCAPIFIFHLQWQHPTKQSGEGFNLLVGYAAEITDESTTARTIFTHLLGREQDGVFQDGSGLVRGSFWRPPRRSPGF
jgi:hypothetical protein